MRDRFGRSHVYLRLAVTPYCDLNCAYCRPARRESPAAPAGLDAATLERLVRIFAGLGVRKVRLTGGEPTVRGDLVELVALLARVPGIETLALTTNGVRLARLAAPLRRAGLEKLNVSLDSLRPERFARITGQGRLAEVLAGIEAALAAGFAPLKLNVVVMRGINDDELADFVSLGRDRDINIRFIEYMPFRENGWWRGGLVPYTEMLAGLRSGYELVPSGRGERTGGVAKDFLVGGHRGRVSFITPISEEFCDRCNRLRVTADGRLKTCLFAPAGPSLTQALAAGASDAEVGALVRGALAGKPQHHPETEALTRCQDQAMDEIGG